ncbi:MAG: hypothetical protein ACODAA_04365 [Gemmatimonadota bacterium]
MAGRTRSDLAPTGGRRGARRPLGTAVIGLSLVLVSVAMSGCNNGGGEAQSGDAGPLAAESMTYDTLVARLAETGVGVQADDATVEQPWSDVPGRRLETGGETVQVFEYPSAGEAQRQAGSISADGTTIGPHRVEWVEPARFYRAERLVVLYVGTSEATIEALGAVLGPPFAGPGASGGP